MKWNAKTCLSLLVIVVPMLCMAEVTESAATLVIRDARVITMDEQNPTADGFAVRDNRIILVGTDKNLQTVIGPSTKVVSLHGRTVVPGLIDGHLYPVPQFPVGHRLHRVDLSAASTGNLSALLNRLKAQAAQ